MSEKKEYLDKYNEAAKKSNDINMSDYMVVQFKLITAKIDEQGEKVSKMYNWLINDPETGDHGIIRTVKSNTDRISVLETNELLRKREVKLIAAVFSGAVTLIGGAIYTVINHFLNN